jgi:hypothetical protein
MSVRVTSGHAIHDIVSRVKGDTVVVKEKVGKEVRMYIDHTTSVTGKLIDQGDRIEARVIEKNHALTICSAK